MRSREFVTELFNQPYPVKIFQDQAVARDPQGRPLYVVFERYPAWETVKVTFDRGQDFALTDWRDEYRIMATVVEAVKKWAAKYQPGSMYFSAASDEPTNRARLYQRMVAALVRGSGYSLIADPDRVDDEAISYYMARIGKRFGDDRFWWLVRDDLIKPQQAVTKDLLPESAQEFIKITTILSESNSPDWTKLTLPTYDQDAYVKFVDHRAIITSDQIEMHEDNYTYYFNFSADLESGKILDIKGDWSRDAPFDWGYIDFYMVEDVVQEILDEVRLNYGSNAEEIQNELEGGFGLGDLNESYHDPEWTAKVARHLRLRALAKRTKDEEQFDLHNAALAKLYGVDQLPATDDSTFTDDPGGIAIDETSGHDYMAGHCHVMALALKQLHPDWQIRAHVGWDEDADDDDNYRVDHVYIIAPDGSAYDCRGRFDNEESLVGPDTTGGIETQFVDYSLAHIKQDIQRGELRAFSRRDLLQATKLAKQLDENFADGRKPGRKGLSRRVGIPKKATLGQLEKIARSSTGERRRMAQWQLNMRRGKKNK